MLSLSELLNVSASPHVRSNDSTKTIMRDVAIALVPAAGFGVYNFGVKALLILLASIASCMLTEYIYEMLMHKKITTSDYSALVTGLLLGMNLPASVPIWMPILGGVFAILIVKQLFGGLGQNFMNPALAARCFLMISFAKRMTTFTYDGVTGATPLYLIKSGDKANAVSDILSQGGTSIFDMFTGNIAGTIVVKGNNDKDPWGCTLPKSKKVNLDDFVVYVVHDKKDIEYEKLDDVNIVVYGHSHKYNEENYRGITFINPGSCGRRRFSLPLTMAIVKGDKDNISVEKIILE